MSIPTYAEYCAIAYPLRDEPQAPRPVRHWCECGRRAVDFICSDEPWRQRVPVCEECGEKYDEAQKNERPRSCNFKDLGNQQV